MPEAIDCERISETIGGDLTTFVIDQLRNLECAFRYLTEDQQRELITTAQQNVNRAIVNAVRMIASEGRDCIPVQIKKVVNTGTEVQAVAIASRSDPLRNALFDLAGYSAVLVVADASRFMGGDAPKAAPDQGGMFEEPE